MTHIGAEIHRLNKLKDDLASTVAYLYDYANFAHPFRELRCAVASRCKDIAR
jgi:cell filamentation protein